MAAAGDGVAAVGRRLAMLAAVQRQSGSRSFNRVFPRSRLLYLAPLTSRGRAGGVGSPPR